jgi:predicted alpha/beta superfamily hydrolase
VTWKPYEEVYGTKHTVVGDVRVMQNVSSSGLKPRNILVYLPPNYELETRDYPVLYMHDGQNIFDDVTSYAGEWGVDESAECLAARGLKCIIVGIPNGAEARLDEYGPWEDERLKQHAASGQGGRALEYLAFLLGNVKPLIDSSFRTSRLRSQTGISGSSMGGLVSLWAALEARETFGFCAALSSSFWLGGKLEDFVESRVSNDLRIYLDVGAKESNVKAVQKSYLASNRKIRDLLKAQDCDLVYLEDANGLHNEADWRRRFPAVLEWFLNPAMPPKLK